MIETAREQLTRLQEQWMDKIGTVTRRGAGTADTLGEYSTTTTTFDLPCRINSADAADERIIAESQNVVQARSVSYPTRFTLRSNDTISVDGQVLQVIGIIEAESFETVHRAVCKGVR